MSDAKMFTINRPESHMVRVLPVMYKKFATHRLADGSYEDCPRLVAKLSERGGPGRSEAAECPLCDHYSQLLRASETCLPSMKETLRREARELKPILQYYVPIIDREDPQAGPMIWKVSESLFQKVLKGIVDHPKPIRRPKWYQFWTKIKNWWNGVRYATSVLDEHEGLDFMIIKTFKHMFPDYSSSQYIDDPKPIGPRILTIRWIEEAAKMMDDLKQSPNVKKKEPPNFHDL